MIDQEKNIDQNGNLMKEFVVDTITKITNNCENLIKNFKNDKKDYVATAQIKSWIKKNVITLLQDKKIYPHRYTELENINDDLLKIKDEKNNLKREYERLKKDLNNSNSKYKEMSKAYMELQKSLKPKRSPQKQTEIPSSKSKTAKSEAPFSYSRQEIRFKLKKEGEQLLIADDGEPALFNLLTGNRMVLIKSIKQASSATNDNIKLFFELENKHLSQYLLKEPATIDWNESTRRGVIRTKGIIEF